MLRKNRISFILNLSLVLVLLSGLIVLPPVGSVRAATLTVTNTNDSGAGSLRQAIADAASGDTITFDPSLAGGSLSLSSQLAINKNLTIDGSTLNPPLTLSGGPTTRIIHVDWPAHVTISGLILTNGNATSGNGGAVYAAGSFTAINSTFFNNSAGGSGGAISGGTIKVINSTFTRNFAGGNGGAIIGVNLDISNTTIHQNQANQEGGAIAIYGDGTTTIVNSTIFRNQAGSSGGGMFITGYATVDILNSTFAENTAMNGHEFILGTIYHIAFANTIFACNATSDGCYVAAGNTILNTNSILGVGSLSDFGLSEPADHGGPTETMALLPDSPLIDAGDNSICATAPVNSLDQRGVSRQQGSHCDIGAYEDQFIVRYVKQDATGTGDGSSWTNAYTDLQSALAVASPDEEIWVAAGTYKPTSTTDRMISLNLKSGVAVYGGFAGAETLRNQRDYEANPTILSGDIGVVDDNSDNSYHVVVGSFTTNSAILDGFTVTAGKAKDILDFSSESRGGGMFNYLGSPSVRNTIFIDNSAAFGGGMYNGHQFGPPDIASYPILANVIFESNSAFEGGGAFNENYVHATLTNVIFDNNTASRVGGGMEDRLGVLNLTNVVFKNNTAGSPAGGAAGGLQIFSYEAYLTNVTFSNNSAVTYGGGMANADGSPTLDPELTNVTFHGNSAEFGGGMWNYHSNPMLTNVSVYGNSASTSGGGIYSESNSNLQVQNAILWGNTAPTGAQIYHDNTSTFTVSDSVVQGGFAGGTNVITTDPLLGTLGNYGGFTETMPLQAGSSAIDTGNDLNCPATDQRGVVRPQGSHCDIGAYEDQTTVRYVKWDATGANNGSSWTDAYTDLQDALAAVSSDDEIWVAAGTYYPTTGTGRTISFTLKNGVAVYGGFAGTETLVTQRDPSTNVTTLSGDIGASGNNSDNSYHVVIGSGTNNSAILDGFTITAGNADGSSHPHDKGGGMYTNKGHPSLTNVIFGSNSATFGGGMYNDGEFAYPDGSNPILTNVSFVGNSAIEGGGMENMNHSNPTLTNVTFSNNTAIRSGGGMINLNQSSPTLTNITFSENAASAGGGMMVSSSNPSLTNVTFSANSAIDWGGGIYNDNGSKPNMTNVTFNGNEAGEGGGMYNAYGSEPTITNSIVYGNPGGDIFDVSGTRVVTYSIVQGGYPGTGNLDADPLLGPLQDNGGFTQTMALQSDSPAIDSSNDATCAATDQRGVTRPQGSHCDMGAYEFEPTFAKVDISVAGTTVGDGIEITPGSGQRVGFPVDNGPAQVVATNGFDIVTALRVIWREPGQRTSYSEMMGLPVEQLSDEYWFPWYNNLDKASMDQGFRIANVDEADTIIKVMLRTTELDSFTLGAGESVRVAYDVNDGPIQIYSEGGHKILAALRVIWQEPGSRYSYSEMMGLPVEQLSDEYWFPWYNNLDKASMDQGFRIASVNFSGANTVEVRVAGALQQSFSLAQGASVRVGYDVNNGPAQIVCTTCTGNEKIVTSLRVIWKEPGFRATYSEMMGLPFEQLSTSYWFPWYNNADVNSMDQGFRIATVNASGDNTVQVWIAGIMRASFPLGAGESVRVGYDVNNGPAWVVCTTCTSNEKIVTSLRVIWKEPGVRTSYSEMMGLPNEALSSEYWFPWYNNLFPNTIMDQGFRISTP